jgi:Uma2 family endonuclease
MLKGEEDFAMNAPVMPPPVHRPQLLLDASSNGSLMSPEEFDSISHDNVDPRFRYELLHGVVIVSPPPSDGEVGPNDDLGHLLRSYQETPQGKALDATLFEREIATSVGIRRVDRAIWIGYGRLINSKQDLPTIVVEFVSPGKRARLRDYQQKRVEYLAAGCKEYWVIDRFRRTMTVYFLPPASPPERIVTESETYTTPLLPGFELPLKRLLRQADQFADEEGV